MQSRNNTDPSLKYIERKNDAISLLQELAKKNANRSSLVQKRLLEPHGSNFFVEIKKSKYLEKKGIHQDGVYATDEIPCNTVLGIYDGCELTEKEFCKFNNIKPENISFQTAPYLLNLPNGNFLYPLKEDMDRQKMLETFPVYLLNHKSGVGMDVNCQAEYHEYKGKQYTVFTAHGRIDLGAELLWDYGKNFADELMDNKSNVSTLNKQIPLKTFDNLQEFAQNNLSNHRNLRQRKKSNRTKAIAKYKDNRKQTKISR